MTPKSLILRPWELRAMLDGRLKQVRRVVKLQEFQPCTTVPGSDWYFRDSKTGIWSDVSSKRLFEKHTPYAVGDTVAVKESWFPKPKSDGGGAVYKATDAHNFMEGMPWKSPVTMPLWASRLSCVVTGVRCERVQEISQEDMLRCGVTELYGLSEMVINTYYEYWKADYPRYPWESNPFAWVYELGEVEK